MAIAEGAKAVKLQIIEWGTYVYEVFLFDNGQIFYRLINGDYGAEVQAPEPNGEKAVNFQVVTLSSYVYIAVLYSNGTVATRKLLDNDAEWEMEELPEEWHE